MGDMTNRIGGASSSLAFKAPCRVATTAAISLSSEQTIDGVAVVDGDRVLVKDQATATANGIHVVKANTVWVRARDFDGNSDVVTGSRVYVHSGSVGIGEYVVTTADPVIIDTSSITFGIMPAGTPVGASTDNAVVRFNGAGGAIQGSDVTIDDDNAVLAQGAYLTATTHAFNFQNYR